MWAKQDPRPPRQLGGVPAEPSSTMRTHGSLFMSLKMPLNCSGTNEPLEMLSRGGREAFPHPQNWKATGEGPGVAPAATSQVTCLHGSFSSRLL